MAIELINKYRDFTNNEIKAALDKADVELRKYIAPIATLNSEALEKKYTEETSDSGDVLSSLAPVLEHIKNLVVNSASRSAMAWPKKDECLAAAEIIVSEEVEAAVVTYFKSPIFLGAASGGTEKETIGVC